MTREELEAQVAEIQNIWNTLHTKKANAPKRNKYAQALSEWQKLNLPVMRLNDGVFNNKSEQSMQQQFNKAAEAAGIKNLSVVFTDTGKFLIDFDSESAEATFASLLERVSTEDVTQLSNQLLRATR